MHVSTFIDDFNAMLNHPERCQPVEISTTFSDRSRIENIEVSLTCSSCLENPFVYHTHQLVPNPRQYDNGAEIEKALTDILESLSREVTTAMNNHHERSCH